MSGNQAKKDVSTRTRRAIIDALKQQGGMDVVSLSSQFSLSGMAIRQHLNGLKEEGFVTHIEEARPMGRPTKLWILTPAADRFFPSGYSDLSVSLIQSMKEAFGETGLDQLLAVRNQNMQVQYARHLEGASDIKSKLDKLAEIRTMEGYMAEVKEQDDGSLLFIEKHCPICAAAAVCTGLCRNELQLFKTVLGEDVQIERGEYILAGGRNCVYTVSPAQK
ncbi:helix-turn-helix transcriptional regulator [Paenibacillus silvae]|jgi:predicted ArsR family transcriptional regulator|uniref:helix-turn-helix transcriptional regulator n=1 Tax=Paenibacillus TaxID=44249 RepID=UPI001C117AB0|nr:MULTISPECIES: ArsR family transcriptional regulator [Paenibacillus]MBU5354082.1 ArsR family transcriptional regulator [Paenibacillus barcinonensis]MDM5276342.1 ArsR family transcriptional regulator [Paenibacillus silvae]